MRSQDCKLDMEKYHLRFKGKLCGRAGRPKLITIHLSYNCPFLFKIICRNVNIFDEILFFGRNLISSNILLMIEWDEYKFDNLIKPRSLPRSNN